MILWSAVGVVLLMGCVNIASLLLARIPARAQELATRIALGGGKSGIIGQMLTESLVLAMAGGLAGVGTGYLGIYAFKAWVPPDLNIWQVVHLDGRVLFATLGFSVLTSVLFGTLPAFCASRLNVQAGLTDGGSRGVAGRQIRWPLRIFGSSAEFVGKTVFHRRLRRPRCSPSLKASLASSAAAPALTLGCAPRCRLVWAMGNGASGGGSGHRV